MMANITPEVIENSQIDVGNLCKRGDSFGNKPACILCYMDLLNAKCCITSFNRSTIISQVSFIEHLENIASVLPKSEMETCRLKLCVSPQQLKTFRTDKRRKRF